MPWLEMKPPALAFTFRTTLSGAQTNRMPHRARGLPEEAYFIASGPSSLFQLPASL